MRYITVLKSTRARNGNTSESDNIHNLEVAYLYGLYPNATVLGTRLRGNSIQSRDISSLININLEEKKDFLTKQRFELRCYPVEQGQ